MEGLRWDSSDTNCSTILNDHFVSLGVACKVQIVVDGPGRVNVGMCGVAATASLGVLSSVIHIPQDEYINTHISVDPLKPVLSAVASDEILEIIGGRDTLRFGSSKEVLHNRIGIVSL